MSVAYPSSQCSGIWVAVGVGRLWEPKVVDNFKETAFSRYNSPQAHMKIRGYDSIH